MADEPLKDKIRNLLKSAYFSHRDDLVDVADGDDDGIHIVVVSRKLDPLSMKERNDLIWSHLTSALSPQEYGQITLAMGTSPEEIKAF